MPSCRQGVDDLIHDGGGDAAAVDQLHDRVEQARPALARRELGIGLKVFGGHHAAQYCFRRHQLQLAVDEVGVRHIGVDRAVIGADRCAVPGIEQDRDRRRIGQRRGHDVEQCQTDKADDGRGDPEEPPTQDGKEAAEVDGVAGFDHPRLSAPSFIVRTRARHKRQLENWIARIGPNDPQRFRW
jgi:hypothetical protein